MLTERDERDDYESWLMDNSGEELIVETLWDWAWRLAAVMMLAAVLLLMWVERP